MPESKVWVWTLRQGFQTGGSYSQGGYGLLSPKPTGEVRWPSSLQSPRGQLSARSRLGSPLSLSHLQEALPRQSSRKGRILEMDLWICGYKIFGKKMDERL